MDMQTVHSKKVDRFRRWLASHTQNMVVCRFSCGVCSGRWHVAWDVSRDKLQDFVYRSRAMERRNAEAFQFHACSQGNLPFTTQRLLEYQIWNDDSLESRFLIPSVSYGVIGDAS